MFGRVIGFSKSANGYVSDTAMDAVLVLSDGTVVTVALDLAAYSIHGDNAPEYDEISP